MPVANRLLLAFVVWEIAVLLAFPARAQDNASPRERALLGRISAEINTSLACSTEVAVLQDRIKDLEQKLKTPEKK